MLRFVSSLFALGVLLVAAGFAGIMGLYAYYARELPDPGALSNRQLFQTARILDRNGNLLEELIDPAGGRRTLVTIDQVPPILREATIAAEDATFYSNPGFEPRAILRAVYQWARYGSPQSGASTITQQLVKNTLLGPEVTAERKIKEAFLAMELSRRYSKDQVLEMYLNEIYYGNLAYGIEAASETYFGKPARELTLPEASFLAGLPQAPASYDPYTRLPEAKERQRYVLDQMARTDAITQQQADAAYRATLNIVPRQRERSTLAPHFTAYVREQLEERFGTEALFRNGLQVTTTLDLGLQQLAEQTAARHVDSIRELNATNAALVAMQPATGEVLAMLGSVDFDDPSIDGQVNVALAPRQPGSTLKPFTYLTSFAKGWNPATMLMDIPTTFGGDYRPNDFDGKFRGPVRIRDALAQSLNIPAVEALRFTSIPDMLSTVHRMGIQGLRQPERYGLSVTLGGGEVRLVDLTYAYAGLASGGRQVGVPVPDDRREEGFRQFEPVTILEVHDSTGKVIYQYTPPEGAQVADPRLVYQITSILSDTKARIPTYGDNNPLTLPGRPVAAKTGTTDDYRDSWVVGYTPDLVTGVWVGNSDNSPMKGVLGARGAGQIWHDFMAGALEGTPAQPFATPAGVEEAEVCALNGLLATPDCKEAEGTVRDVFVPGVNMPPRDDWHQRVEVCKVNGKLVTPLVPANGREQRIFVRFPQQYQAWAEANAFPQPPTEHCDDVYRGEHKAEVTEPRPSDRLVVGASFQVTGSAYIDDFASYTLDFGPGTNPLEWRAITDKRPQGVDSALLGVWDTKDLQPGQYTLRLRVFDSLGNAQEGRTTVTLSPTPTPTPTPATSPTPARLTPTATPGPSPPGPTPTPRPTQAPAQVIAQPTPTRAP